MLIVCNGNNVTFDTGITCIKDSGADIAIIGGKDVATSDTSETASVQNYTITVNSGTWSYIRGGNRRGNAKSAIGNISGVSVIINDGIFTGTDPMTIENLPDLSKLPETVPVVSPGGHANLNGNLYLEINGGTFGCSIFGIARPGTNSTNTLLSNKGNVEIKITGGTFNGVYINAIQNIEVATLNGSYALTIMGGTFNNIQVLSAENVKGSSTAEVIDGLKNLLASFQKAIFVADYGDDSAIGKSPASAFKTLDAAYAAAVEGGVVVVCGKLTLSPDYNVPVNVNEIRLTSVYGGIDYSQTEQKAEILLGGTLTLNGKTVFSDVLLNGSSSAAIECNGKDTTFGTGIVCSGDIAVAGGNNAEGYSLVINSGTWSDIRGGSTDNGSIGIIIGGGAFNHLSAGDEGVVNGSHYIEINGGTFLGDINGVIAGSQGNVSMVISNGTFSNGKISATKSGTINGDYGLVIAGGDFTNNPAFSAEGVAKTSIAYVPADMSDKVNTFDIVSEQTFVYVKDGGSGNGSSPANAYGNLTDTYNALPEGGTIVVSGPLSLNADFNAPLNNKQITITNIIAGVDYRKLSDAQINMGASYYINGPTLFENLKINMTARDKIFCCNGNATIFGDGIEGILASPKMVYAGINSGVNISTVGEDGTLGTSLTIKSGKWQIVRGGNRRATMVDTMRTITGDINMLITGGDFYGNVSGGGQNDQIGNINLTIEGGNFTRSLNALCLPSSNSDIGTHTGNITVTINGGTFCGIIGPSQDPVRMVMNGKYTININGGDFRSVTTIQGTEGLPGQVTSEINIGKNVDINQLETGIIEFTNPVSSGQDPSLTYHDGYYYYMYAGSYNGRVCLYLSKSLNLSDIGRTTFKMVWQPEEGSEYGKMIWSPKLYYLDGSWYIYAACSPDVDPNLRVYVLKAKTDDPMGEYELIGKMNKIDSRWAIGPHIMELNGKRYFMFTGNTVGNDGVKDLVNDYQILGIAEMENPWTLATDPVEICKPDYSWEKNGWNVVEGATYLKSPNGKVYIMYSASGAWTDDYALGRLSLIGDDPLVPENWVKHPEPVFSRVPDIYGPGHAAFTKSLDGTEGWIVYHANLNQNAGFSGRSIFIQKFTWDENSVPVFGAPLALGTVQTWKANPMSLAKKIDGFQVVNNKNYIPPEDEDGSDESNNNPSNPDDSNTPSIGTIPSEQKDPKMLDLTDISYDDNRVMVTFTENKNYLSKDAEDKLVKENEDKSVIITGKGLHVIIQKGTLSASNSINNMIADTSKVTASRTQVVRYIDEDGKPHIIKFCIVGKDLTSYIATGSGTYEIIENSKKIGDINGHWAFDSINFTMAHELFNGINNTDFSPEDSMTRAMFVTVLGRLHGNIDINTNSGFKDVPDGMWYTNFVAWANKNGIASGYEDGSFDPDNAVTREQLCVMLYRYMKYTRIEPVMQSKSVLFDDYNEISSWAQNATSIMQQANLIQGKPGNLFDPKGKVTRAEVAAILHRLIESSIK